MPAARDRLGCSNIGPDIASGTFRLSAESVGSQPRYGKQINASTGCAQCVLLIKQF
jgi:hypothetical protein